MRRERIDALDAKSALLRPRRKVGIYVASTLYDIEFDDITGLRSFQFSQCLFQ